MYFPLQNVKHDPIKRWALSDRIFFGFGACHILSGVYLKKFPHKDIKAIWIKPKNSFSGNHIFVSDHVIAFDYHGYTCHDKLLEHYWNGWSKRYPGWEASIAIIDFDLLDTDSLNARKMLGPNQYAGDPIQRAEKFIEKFKIQYL